MKIEKVNTASLSYEKLQAFVSRHQLLFNSSAWLQNYTAAATTQCVILNNNNDVIGCFFYFTFKKGWYNFVITAPYSPNIDLFYINPAESVVGRNSFNKEVSEALSNYFNSLKADYININLPEKIIDVQPFIWSDYAAKGRYSYLIDLAKSAEQLWDGLASEKRKSINKAVKDQLEIKVCDDRQLVFDLICKSLERNDVARNRAILEKIIFHFASTENSYAFVAWHQQRPIGATFCVIDRNKSKAIYLFGGFDAENKHHGAGVSCMWQSILKAKELGLKQFDFEGSMRADIERYFREFGGDLIQYNCVEKIKPGLKFLLRLKGHKPL